MEKQNQAQKAKKTTAGGTLAHGVGRRKKARARTWAKRGSGKLLVNGREYTTYFDTDTTRLEAAQPMKVLPIATSYDFDITVEGGGLRGQAGAVKLAVARALLALDEATRPLLRQHGLLTVDSRVKERKKYGQRGARRKFQFVKR